MATELEIKARERRELLDEIKKRRSAAAQAEGSLGAAERGDYGEVGQGEKGPFDDEVNQDPNNPLENLMSLQGGDVSQLDLTKAQRTGLFEMSPKSDEVMKQMKNRNSLIKKGLGMFFRRTPIGLALTYGPEIAQSVKNFMMPVRQADTGTGEILNIKPDDLEGIITPGGTGTTAGKIVKIDLTDKNIINILERARRGDLSELQAALEIQKLKPGSGMIAIDNAAPAGIKSNPKFRNIFDEYVTNKNVNDVFETKIIGNKNSVLSRTVKGNIMKAKKIADEDVSDVDYGIKFQNALSEFYTPRNKSQYSASNNVFYSFADDGVMNNAKAIFEFLNINPSILKISKKGGENTGLKNWNKIKTNSDEAITGDTFSYFRANIIIDNTGKTFQQTKSDLINKNKFVKAKLLQSKKLFENPSKIFDVDHIQAPRFGGTNAKENLQILPVGEHGSLKALSPEKIISSQAVKSKSNFENEFFKKSTEIINLIKKGDEKKALELSSQLDNMVNNFKNTFKNTNFKVGEPHLPKKTGDKTGTYVKYSEKLNLSKEQKELVNKLLNKEEYSNLSNVGKTIEQQASEILDMYEQLSLLSPTGKIPDKPLKIPGDITSMDIPRPAGEVDLRKDVISFKKDGGMISIKEMIRPINAQR